MVEIYKKVPDYLVYYACGGYAGNLMLYNSEAMIT
jgi:hypothetical protein